MPLPGPEPSSQPVRRRNKPTHEWVEVDGVQFEGAPDLPGRWGKAVMRWWHSTSRMPHCALWDESDWQFAIDTAYIAREFYGGDIKAASEMRRREAIMGTTFDSRRKLRIRYVTPSVEVPAGVAAIEDYRRRLE